MSQKINHGSDPGGNHNSPESKINYLFGDHIKPFTIFIALVLYGFAVLFILAFFLKTDSLFGVGIFLGVVSSFIAGMLVYFIGDRDKAKAGRWIYIQLILKRAIDLFISVISLFYLLPIMFIIGLAIKIDSPGPIFERRQVLGKFGRKFYAVKFRTKYKNKPEVTRVGKLLRYTSLDEVPQLWNIIKGDMSLIGPRYVTSEQLFENKLNQHRFTFRPGLSGLWQISVDDFDIETMDQFDMEYIDNWHLTLDLEIMIKSMIIVLRDRNK